MSERQDDIESRSAPLGKYVSPKDLKLVDPALPCRSTAEKLEELGQFPRRVVLSRGPTGRVGKSAYVYDELIDHLRQLKRINQK